MSPRSDDVRPNHSAPTFGQWSIVGVNRPPRLQVTACTHIGEMSDAHSDPSIEANIAINN